MVFGTFDILHPGHLFLFTEAKKLGNNLIVIVARDTTVQSIKKIEVENKEDVRLENIKNLNIADKIILGNTDDKYQVIREEAPDVIALGYDQVAFTEKLVENFPNIKIVRLPPYKENIYKSSKLRNN